MSPERCRRRAAPSLLALAVALAAAVAGCGRDAGDTSPIVVVGIDGGEWSVIERLWGEGRLPNLRRVAEEGTTAPLATAYGVSPAIWTTIATGYPPGIHGITGFAIAGPKGDVPVSSSVRRVPALWNLASAAGRRVAVLGWYATWPVEPVDGLIVSDHVMRRELDERLHPPERLPEIEARLAAIRELSEESMFPLNAERVGPRGRRDVLVEELLPEVAAAGYDLVLAYFRTVDHLSHLFWDYYEPEAFDEVDPEDAEAKARLIPAAYERIDRVIGRLRETAPRATLLIVSDHGFNATPDTVRISLDMDTLLERLGYLERDGAGIDMRRTRAFVRASSKLNPRKTLRFAVRGEVEGGGVAPEELPALRRQLSAVLESLVYAGGDPVFAVTEDGDGLVAQVQRRGLSWDVYREGRRLEDFGIGIRRISGGHAADKHGIFLAAGPTVVPDAPLGEIGIHDLAPTLLYALGLPVAEDFVGAPVESLFTDAFRARRPLRTVPTWRMERPAGARTSAADEEILEELRALGYLQ